MDAIENKSPLSILIAEDYAIYLRLITAALLRHGHKVDAAPNGQVAVDKFSTNHYDVILMDIMMPVMDGLTAAREIRNIETRKGIPRADQVKIIAITANAFEDDRTRFSDAGMDFYMNKPVEIDELQRLLMIDHTKGRV